MRLAETGRANVTLSIDGQAATALEGDTLLVALLSHGRRVRDSEFGDGARAGFCLMGACQDCWVWSEAGERLRACSTVVAPGMAVRTRPPAQHWPMTPDLVATLARVDTTAVRPEVSKGAIGPSLAGGFDTSARTDLK